MGLRRAERGAVAMSLSKRRQAAEVNKLFPAAKDLELREGGRLQPRSVRDKPASSRTGRRNDAIMFTPEGEAEYDDETGDTMAVDESRQNVEGSGVDLSAPAGGGCHVYRGRSAK